MSDTNELQSLREQVQRQQADLVVMRLLVETLINRHGDHSIFANAFQRRLDDAKATLAEQAGMQDMLNSLDQKAKWILERATTWPLSPPL